MKCPNCNATLVMTDRSGVEIDYCPDCRGVWLDRGELDKIIDRASQSSNNIQSSETYRQTHSDNKPYDKNRKKRGSFLDDLFDF